MNPESKDTHPHETDQTAVGTAAAGSTAAPDNAAPAAQTPAQPTWDAHGESSAAPSVSPVFGGGQASPVMEADPVPSGSVMPASAGGNASPVVISDSPKKKRLVLASAIIGAIVLLGGGSAAAYYGYILPNKPQNILNAALVNEFTPGKVNTVDFHGSYSAKQTGESTAMSGSFKGSFDKNGPFQVSGDVDAMVTKVTFDLRSADGKDYYVRVGGLEGLDKLLGQGDSGASSSSDSTMSMLSPWVSAVNNQWVIINQSLIKQYVPNANLSDNMQLSADDSHKLADAYKQHQFLVVQQKLADETVAGHPSQHLKVVVDKTQLKGFMGAVKAANISKLKITSDQLNDANKSIDNADLGKYPVDVWVSKSNKLIDQISFDTSDKDGSFHTMVTVDDWNKAVKVDKPAGAKSLLDLLGQVMGEGGMNALDTSLMDGGSGSGISL